MDNRLKFCVQVGDILSARVDVVVLKYAGSFHGADKAVAQAIGYSQHLDISQHAFAAGKSIAAKEALFVGVGPLSSFRYEEIRKFGRAALGLVAKERPKAESLAFTIHGPGYGLDEQEAFLSLLSGLFTAREASGSHLRSVQIVERSGERVRRLEQLLSTSERARSSEQNGQRERRNPRFSVEASSGVSDQMNLKLIADAEEVPNVFSLKDYGAPSERKPKLFVAMPFAAEFLDEYEIGFTEPAHKNGFLCERLDLESFVGDVVSEIKIRILNCAGVIALLNDHNPNVFLEIGFALAHGKPVILVVKKGTKIPFDVQGQRYLEYKRIHELREMLTAEIAKLKASGILGNGRRRRTILR